MPMVDPRRTVNINKANVEDFEQLPGIGKTRAQAIVEHRDVIGGFTDVTDIQNVPGVSKQLLESISGSLVCTHGRPSKHRSNLNVATRRSGEYVKPLCPNGKLAGKRKINGKSVSDVSLSPVSLSPIKKPKSLGLKLETCSAMLSPAPDVPQPFPHYLSPSCATPSCTVRRRVPTSFVLPPENLSKWLEMFQRWTSDERAYALDALIESCDMSLVRLLMAKIEPQFQRDFISLLPKELALYVLAFLEPKDLCKAAQTCRYWRILAEDNLLWREKCKEHEVEVEEKEECPRIITRRRSSQGLQRIIHDHSEFSCSPFKKAFLKQHTLEMNWRHKPLPTPKLLKGHDDHVITCLQFDGNKIVSGSDDNTLKVWSALTGTIIRTLVGHTGGVWSSQLKDNVVVSGSTDRTLRIWNADTGVCLHVLYGHTSTVRCLAMHQNTVVSGSRDGTLRVWDITLGECLKVLVGHSAAVRCVQYDGKRVVSGAYDYVVKVWDPDTETCLHTLSGHTNRVYSLQFDGSHIVSGSLDTSIRVWNAVSGQLVQTLIGHQSLTSGMVLRNNTLVSGNADSTVKVWDIVSGQCRHTLAGPNKHRSAVTSLQFNNKFVVTSSDDGSVKLWDLQTGEFVRDLVKLDSGGSGGVVWRVKCNDKKLVCAVGSRNGTEETKLLVLDFDMPS